MGKSDKKKVTGKSKGIFIKAPIEDKEELKRLAAKAGVSQGELVRNWIRGGGKFPEFAEQRIQKEMRIRKLDRREAVVALISEATILAEREERKS